MSNVFHAIATQIADLKIESLERRNDPFSFSPVHNLTRKIHEAAKYLADENTDISLIDLNAHQHIMKRLKAFSETCNQILDFDVTQGNPNDTKNAIEASIRDHHVHLLQPLLIPIQIMKLVSIAGKGGFEDKITEGEGILNDLRMKLDQANTTLQGIQSASGEVGFTVEADHFSNESAAQKKSAAIWLRASGLTLVLLGFMTFSMIYFQKPPSEFIDQPISFISYAILTKLLPISLGVLVLMLVVRNYMAKMHLQTVNKHRENCLRTFKAFASATDDKQVRDVILTQAVKSIFEPGQSGYVKDVPGSSQGYDITRFATGMGPNTDT